MIYSVFLRESRGCLETACIRPISFLWTKSMYMLPSKGSKTTLKIGHEYNIDVDVEFGLDKCAVLTMKKG